MNGLVFKEAPPAATSSPNRADIACFIGFVSRRRAPVPAGVAQWLKVQAWPNLGPAIQQNRDLKNIAIDPPVRAWLLANGWAKLNSDQLPALDLLARDSTSDNPGDKTWLAYTPVPEAIKTWLQQNGWRPLGELVRDDDPLLGLPVPLESFESFDRIYAWETRPPQPLAFTFTTWLGAAVRSFFRQGGARCLVARVDDPGMYTVLAENTTAADKAAYQANQRVRLGQLLPGFVGGTTPPSLSDPSTWRGLGIMCGLSEAAFVCLPDLPELIADAALEPAGLDPVKPGPEVFVDYSLDTVPDDDDVRQVSASPACTETGYLQWRTAVRHAAIFVRAWRRDVQLVLSLPLPAISLKQSYTRNLDQPDHPLGLGRSLDEPDGIATAFLQLGYPWLVTPGVEALPGELEAPEGVLAGTLARSIPELGVAHSIGRQTLRGVQEFKPALAEPDLTLDTPPQASPALIHRVTLLGRTPDGMRVLSDVTTSLSETHRPASIGRLTAAILRTARQLGDNVTFEPSGEELWQKIRTQLDRLLGDFYAAGALDGDSAADAYSIRCDETTTTQNDLDSGRVIAEVQFAPSYPVGLITVVLSLREGSVTIVGEPT